MGTTENGDIRLRIAFHPHWVNGWFLSAFTRPWARVDGTEYPCRWSGETVVETSRGDHTVETYVRYRGTSTDVGTGRLTVVAAEGDDLLVVARNGWANHAPFLPTLA